MKMVVLCGITLIAAAPAFAQTISDTRSEKAVTLAGCVAGAADSKGITLTNPMIIPGTAQPGQVDQAQSPVPPAVSPATTEPPSSATPPTSTTSAAAAPITPTAPYPTGTAGSTRTASGAVATSGVVSGTAPDSSSSSIISGYRLSGADMKPWIGQRVQLLGTFVAATPSAAAPTTVTGAASTPPVLEFKVQTVQPMTGPCPK